MAARGKEQGHAAAVRAAGTQLSAEERQISLESCTGVLLVLFRRDFSLCYCVLTCSLVEQRLITWQRCPLSLFTGPNMAIIMVRNTSVNILNPDVMACVENPTG